MNLRKEPILFACALALAAYVLSGGTATKLPTTAKPKEIKDAPVTSAPVVVLADPGAHVASVELFREPTEAVPLPPTELPFPVFGRLPEVAPPLPMGPMPGSYWLHRLPGQEPTPHEFPPAKADGDANGGAPQGPAPVQSRGLSDAELAQRFDRVWQLPGGSPQWGLILNPNKLALRPTGPFTDPLQFQTVSTATGQPIGAPRTIEAAKIDKIQFADSIENRIALTRRELSRAQESVPRRIEFIGWLIDEARKDPAIWSEAEKEGQELVAITGSELGYQQVVRVLRAEGDLGKELALYQGLPGEFADSAFRWREQGRLEARLGLDLDAEAHLRAALERRPADAASNHALASYLLSRGRAEEALPFAQQAERSTSQAYEQDSDPGYSSTVASILLALGRVTEAASTLDNSRASSAALAPVRGVLEYARGNLDAAATLFSGLAEKDTGMSATYALAAVRLRQGQFDEARNLFERVRAGAPALRARALGGLALLYERTGHVDLAAPLLEEAGRTDPSDPWIAYLQGRAARLTGDLDDAIVHLRDATRLGDDFVEALAECGLALRAKGMSGGGDAPESLAQSVRYFDRVVALDASRSKSTLFVEIQGEILARVGDVARARRAFESIVEKSSDFARIGLAILDYRQKRSSEARAALAVLQSDTSGAPQTREVSRQLIDLIDDNASKEQVRDGFQRESVGQVWKVQGALAPSIKDGELHFKGNSGSIETETSVRRTLKRAGSLLRCEATFQLHSISPVPAAVGLRVVNAARAGDFWVEVGLFRRSNGLVPELRVHDGQPRSGESEDPIRVENLELDLTGRQSVAIELIPDADRSSHRFDLRIEWNGRVVLERAGLRQINDASSFELGTDLFCSGKPVDVSFDDYRLVRRKETK
ncbi:MAG: tetratricopeptide repeat protein [Planctomycetota bacterium]